MMDIRENIVYTNLDLDEIASWKFLLHNLTLEKINNQFESYINTCLLYPTSFSRIEDNINSMFNVNYLGHDFFPNFRHTITSESGGNNNPYYFFRIRKIEKGMHYDLNNLNEILTESIEFQEIQTLSDVWEKPANQVNHYQRLSKPKRSVLYTSLMTSTALFETNIHEKESLFFLIVYKSKRKINYSDCCNFVYYNNLSEDDNMKRYIIFQFLRNEFTRVLPETYNYENQYCAAESISRKFFISDDVDGIQYPSARGLGQYNFAFWSNTAHDCLEFIGLRCCKLNNRNGFETQNSIFVDCFWNEDLKKFEYVSPFSDKSKQVFGDMLLSILIAK
jgi:hypothetical protein